MSKKMLIDASHPEETRVVIVNGSRIEELDFESSNKRQLRGNVYLARVTRVEPSLQAAFVEYGGNRHGFLAFSEIHPDYYQIPYEDRLALLEAEEAENIAEDEAIEEDAENAESDTDAVDISNADTAETDSVADGDESDDDDVETVAEDEDVVAEQTQTATSRRKRMSRRRYKIQEVIKRGQILLIQVVKEERGNKGAAMTTYLSMAGRYCVLMPNTPRGGGISRKIPNGADRKRLKSVVSEFDVPQGMGVIVRTAGAKRTKLEIKRDYDYLCRLWETTRNTTLSSIAPALIHEEGNLVKRSIRDLYNKDIDEVLVQGDEAYKTAKDFIKMLMPSHAKNVKAYKEDIPLFLRYHVESQIEDSLDSVVQLKSGGYLVIHPTEALVSVDVNSGRSTKERNVERTALKTNLEAAEEVARQMRIRDLAGLIVIDFIDMDENRNNRAVEKRMKDALARDRARVQNSRISQFGLMEISRQRRRRSLLEGSTAHCDHCAGVGRKRTIESSALRAIRAVEEIGVRGKAKRIRLKVAPDVALYVFNEKRELLTSVDTQFNVFTELVGDDTLIRPAFEVEVLESADSGAEDPLIAIEKDLKKQEREADKARHQNNRNTKRDKPEDDGEGADETASDKNKGQKADSKSDSDKDDEGQGKRRRRGRRGGRRRKPDAENSGEDTQSQEDGDTQKSAPSSEDTKSDIDDTSEGKRPRRRRRKPAKSGADGETNSTDGDQDAAPKRGRRKPAPAKADAEVVAVDDKPEKARSTARRKAPSRKPKPESDTPESQEKKETPAKAASDDGERSSKPRSAARRKAPARKPKPATDEDTSSTEAVKAPARPRAKTPVKAKAASTSRRRKAPTRNSDAEPSTPAETAAEAPAEEKVARKRAPARKAAPKKPAAKKAPAKKAAPKKAAPKKAPAKKAAPKVEEKSDAEAKPKPAARKKAPARKAAPKKAAPKKVAPKKETDASEKKTEPVTKAAPKAKPAATKPTEAATPEPKPQGDSTADDSKKKRGWWPLKRK
ncbi:MAG: Rne/Rng family ribonuclease [Alphaproteobacteria bacterium]